MATPPAVTIVIQMHMAHPVEVAARATAIDRVHWHTCPSHQQAVGHAMMMMVHQQWTLVGIPGRRRYLR